MHGMVADEKQAEKRWMALQYKVSEERIKNAFALFRENGIEPILIKGWAAAQAYPDKTERIFTDIDLCVASEKFPMARSLMRTERGKILNVDLHRELRHLDTLSWEDLFENSILLDLDQTFVRVLRAEDHLRVLCVHWLTDGGTNRAKLLDIHYALKNRPADFNWHRLLETIDKNRQEWVLKTIAVANRFHPVELMDCPFLDRLEPVPDWMLRTLKREWSRPVPLKPLQTSIRHLPEFLQQVKKRMPPNPIQATVEMEGSFDSGSRIKYQIGSIMKRIRPSLRSFYRFWSVKRGGE